MKFYRLHIKPSESDSEAEDQDEWFSSLAEAKARRRELILDRGANDRVPDLDIDRVWFATDLTARGLLLAVLNRSGFIIKTEELVAPYEEPKA